MLNTLLYLGTYFHRERYIVDGDDTFFPDALGDAEFKQHNTEWFSHRFTESGCKLHWGP